MQGILLHVVADDLILFHLVKNSLRALSPAHNGHMTIVYQRGEQDNWLSFRDTGIGIPPDNIHDSFIPFYSGYSGTKAEAGTGIGLSFCTSVIESFNGTIACTSEVGKGTEFRITLPVPKS